MAVAEIGRRKRWAPPPNARIDWSHPLSQGLLFFFCGGVDLVSRRRLTTSGSPTATSTPFGPGFAITTASTAYFDLSIANGAAYSSPASYMWAGRQNSNANFRNFMTVGSGSIGKAFDCYSYGTGAFEVFRGNSLSGYSGHTSATGVVVAGDWMHVTATFPNAQNNAAPSVLIDGTPVTMTTTTVGTGTLAVDATANVIRIGRRSDGGTQMDGAVALAAAWGRQLSIAEQMLAYADPFQMLVW